MKNSWQTIFDQGEIVISRNKMPSYFKVGCYYLYKTRGYPGYIYRVVSVNPERDIINAEIVSDSKPRENTFSYSSYIAENSILLNKKDIIMNNQEKTFVVYSANTSSVRTYATLEEAKTEAEGFCKRTNSKYFVAEVIASCDVNAVTWTDLK